MSLIPTNIDYHKGPIIVTGGRDVSDAMPDLTLIGGVKIEKGMEVTGNCTIQGLDVAGNATFAQNVTIDGTLTVGNIIGGGVNANWVKTLDDFPAPVGNVITLPSLTSWYLDAFVNLGPNRIVCAGPVTITGASSETCGLSGSVNSPMLSSNFTLALQNFTFEGTGITVLALDGLGNNMALDWFGVNFLNCTNIGVILNPFNFIFNTGAFLNSSQMIIGGTVGTLSFFQSLLSGVSAATSIVQLQTGSTITRRMRFFFCSVSSPVLSLGINIEAGTTIPNEGFQLFNCNFSGSGTALTGITSSDNRSLWNNNTGIQNTASIGEQYITTPAATILTDVVTFVPIAGTMMAGANISRFTSSSPARLTCISAIQRKYIVHVTGSFTTTNGNQLEIGIYDSVLGATRPMSLVLNTASGSGRAESINSMATLNMKNGDFVEVRCRNLTAANNATFDRLTVVITEI